VKIFRKLLHYLTVLNTLIIVELLYVSEIYYGDRLTTSAILFSTFCEVSQVTGTELVYNILLCACLL
jgi:hypothetical protein